MLPYKSDFLLKLQEKGFHLLITRIRCSLLTTYLLFDRIPFPKVIQELNNYQCCNFFFSFF